MGAAASLSSPKGLQVEHVLDELAVCDLEELSSTVEAYWKAQTPKIVGRGRHAKVIDPELPPAKASRRLCLHYVAAVEKVQKKLEIANHKMMLGKPFMDEKVDKFEKQLEGYKVQLRKVFPPIHSIDGSVDSEAASAALAKNGIENENARQKLMAIVSKIVSGPRRYHFDTMLQQVARGAVGVADFSNMSLTDEQLHQVVEAIISSPKGVFQLSLNGNRAITSAGAKRSIADLLLPAVAAGPLAKRLVLIDLQGLGLVGNDAGLEAAFPKVSPNPLQINVTGTCVSQEAAALLRNTSGAGKIRREATIMCVLQEAAATYRELGLFVALSGY